MLTLAKRGSIIISTEKDTFLESVFPMKKQIERSTERLTLYKIIENTRNVILGEVFMATLNGVEQPFPKQVSWSTLVPEEAAWEKIKKVQPGHEIVATIRIERPNFSVFLEDFEPVE